MKFNSRAERLEWLRLTAQEIQRMEHDRKICILTGRFGKAFELLKAIKFARQEFAKESKKYAKK